MIASICASVVLIACNSPEIKTVTKPEEIKKDIDSFPNLLSDAQAIFKQLPTEAQSEENQITPEKIVLGKMLFYDKRLSKNNSQSCNTCHNLSSYGVDNESTSEGDLKKRGDRNSPTVYNAALHIAQFWDGRAASVEEQAGMPITNPVEMNMSNEKMVIDRLKKSEGYRTLFSKAFPNEQLPITYINLKKAIAAFERTLITPSPFHQFIGGDSNALNAEEKKGLKEFMDAGCTTCHNGSTIGGNSFMKFPLIGTEYMSQTGSKKEDTGKMNVTKNDGDKFVFKVPSLINITETGPYFHDGSVSDLGTAIKIMGKLQLNKELSNDQIKNIKLFLGSLKGKIPEGVDKSPEIPQ